MCSPKNGSHVVLDQALVVEARALAHTWQVLGLEALEQLGHGRCLALGLQLAERIAALVDDLLQPLGLGPRLAGAPVPGVADGEGAIAPAAAGAIAEDVAPRAVGGEPNAKAAHLAVIDDRAAGGGQCGSRLTVASVRCCVGMRSLLVSALYPQIAGRRALSNLMHAVSEALQEKCR